MSNVSLHTTMLNGWLERMRAGDDSAREELFGNVCGKLEQLARRMLRHHPSVKRFEDTGDVLQNSVLRLMRALQEVNPYSVRAFYGLAAVQIRYELVDLARKYGGKLGIGTNEVALPQDSSGFMLDPPDSDRESIENVQRWSDFHEQVEKLPADERETFSLIFYHGWTQSEVAELLGMTERNVRRIWQRARLHLAQALGDNLPT